jgi:hypothetical protein
MDASAASAQSTQIDATLASAMNILIACLANGATTYVSHNRSLRLLLDTFRSYGIRNHVLEVVGESLIPRGRNACASIVALDKDPSGEDYTHLLFLDADIGFNAANIMQMIKWDKDIVALPYAYKDISWDDVALAVKSGVDDPTVLSRMGSCPVVRTDRGAPHRVNLNQPIRFPQFGGGLLLIKRHVLLKFTEDEARRYRLPVSLDEDEKGVRDYAYDFFRIGVNPETRYYDPEDFRFCIDARKMGFETWLLPWAVTTHTGPHEFCLDLYTQAQYVIAAADRTLKSPYFAPDPSELTVARPKYPPSSVTESSSESRTD